MMASQLFRLGIFATMVLLVGFIGSSRAYKFHVGGKDGWVLKPSEDYNHWAERNRFQVNDTLYFKYKKGSDSVLVVDKDDYYSCNTKSPKKNLSDGDSTFTFHHSGPFYFIDGDADHCQKGQRLITVVLAVRPKTPSPPPPPHSPHTTPPPGDDSDAPAPAPAPGPSNHKKSGSMRVVPTSFVGLVLGACVIIGSFVVGMA